jgi:drug/metabolite transporter (DMT)-like permease
VHLAQVRIVFVYLAVCLLWGSTWVVVKVGLQDIPPLHFAGLRMLLAAALLLPFVWRAGILRVKGREWRWMLSMGLLQLTIPFGLLFAGQTMVPCAMAALLFATFPVWLVLLGRFLLPNASLQGRELGCAFLGLIGIGVLQVGALCNESLRGSAHPILGPFLIIASAICCALANLLVRRRGQTLSPLLLTFGQVFGAGLVLSAVGLVWEHSVPFQLTPRALGAIGYLALCGTVLTYLGLFWLIPRVPLATIGTIPMVDTTVAVALGTWIAKEQLSGAMAVGMLLVLGSCALSLPPRRRKIKTEGLA